MYLVKLNDGAELLVELDETDRGKWRATLDDGSTVDLEVRGRANDGTFVLVVDGTQRAFSIDAVDGERFVLAEGPLATDVEVVHAADVVLEKFGAREAAEAADTETLTSPITGIVLRVETEVGATVERGDALVVVEAMKMENAMSAPRGGVVVETFVEPGQTVFVGDPLVEIE